MLSRNEFVKQSLNTHLFFARIMKEHAFFLQIGFTPKDAKFTKEGNLIRMEFDKLLYDVVKIANGVVDPAVLRSGEIVTQYTLESEEISTFYTGIIIPTEITEAELRLESGRCNIDDQSLESAITEINQRSMKLIHRIIDFKNRILTNVLSCKMLTFNYPLLIVHILREARLYLAMIERIQNREFLNLERDIYGLELFWNRVMSEHSLFIRGLLDPTENELINTSNNLAKESQELTLEVIEAIDSRLSIDEVTQNSLRTTEKVRDFNAQGTEGLINCEIQSIMTPLLGDHVLRESNHFIRLLKTFQDKQ